MRSVSAADRYVTASASANVPSALRSVPSTRSPYAVAASATSWREPAGSWSSNETPRAMLRSDSLLGAGIPANDAREASMSLCDAALKPATKSDVAPSVAFSETVANAPLRWVPTPGPPPHGKSAVCCAHAKASRSPVALAVAVNVCASDGDQRSLARSPAA